MAHRIRLAGPWQIRSGAKEPGIAARQPLDREIPRELLDTCPTHLCLERAFNCPPGLDESEQCWLAIQGFPDQATLRLNGNRLIPLEGAGSESTLCLLDEHLRPGQNRLAIDFPLPAVNDPSEWSGQRPPFFLGPLAVWLVISRDDVS